MITRYRPDTDEECRSFEMIEDKEGDYVAYEDYEDELAEKDKEIEGLKKSYRELENNYVMQGAIYEGISDLLRDGGTSDFMMSFPIVSQIADLLSEISLKQICIDEARRDAKAEIAALKAENERLREVGWHGFNIAQIHDHKDRHDSLSVLKAALAENAKKDGRLSTYARIIESKETELADLKAENERLKREAV